MYKFQVKSLKTYAKPLYDKLKGGIFANLKNDAATTFKRLLILDELGRDALENLKIFKNSPRLKNYFFKEADSINKKLFIYITVVGHMCSQIPERRNHN